MDRRKFLKGSLGIGALALTPGLGACGDEILDQVTPPDPDGGLAQVTERVLKGPYVQMVGPSSAVLRFETRVDRALAVTLRRGDSTEDTETIRTPVVLEYARPTLGPDSIPDERGTHILHEVRIDALSAGETIGWSFALQSGEVLEGSFKAPVASTEGFRLGWISDTMSPLGNPAMRLLAAQNPDVVIHGGDLVYDANPLDSWNSIMTLLRGVMGKASFHAMIGNHEHESQDEYTQQYLRLFANQGDRGEATRYFALTYGGVRFICLDSEAGELDDVTSEQYQWLVGELEDAFEDAAIREIIVALHRPTFTLSKHAPGSLSVRNSLHELFLEYNVRLVLAGHVHAYERFKVDGVTYIIDGGGGAILYDPDEDIPVLEETRPGDIELRLAVSQTYGCTTIDFSPDGAMTLTRFTSDDGNVFEIVEFPARG